MSQPKTISLSVTVIKATNLPQRAHASGASGLTGAGSPRRNRRRPLLEAGEDEEEEEGEDDFGGRDRGGRRLAQFGAGAAAKATDPHTLSPFVEVSFQVGPTASSFPCNACRLPRPRGTNTRSTPPCCPTGPPGALRQRHQLGRQLRVERPGGSAVAPVPPRIRTPLAHVGHLVRATGNGLPDAKGGLSPQVMLPFRLPNQTEFSPTAMAECRDEIVVSVYDKVPTPFFPPDPQNYKLCRLGWRYLNAPHHNNV